MAHVQTTRTDAASAPRSRSSQKGAPQRSEHHLLSLQRQAGNATVSRLVNNGGLPTATIQRDHTDTGLKKKDAVERFTGKVKARVTGGKNPLGSTKEWDTLSDDQRVGKLTKYVNVELTKAHVPTVGATLNPGMATGNAEFDFQTWRLTIGASTGLANLTDQQIARLADVVYHESRHAEQWFRMARLKAGEEDPFGDGNEPTSGTIAQRLYIPANVAEAAMKRPLKPLTKTQKFFHTKKWAERQETKKDEAESWYDSVYGAGGGHRGQVLGDIQNRYNDYRALSEEVDAWAVGGDASAKLTTLLAEFRQKEQLKQQARNGATN